MNNDDSQVDQLRFLIGGAWRPSISGHEIPNVNPATGEPLGRVAVAGEEDIDAAVRAARASFERGSWRDMPPGERAATMRRAADILAKRTDALAETMTAELGCTITFAERVQVPSPIQTLRYFADLAENYQWEEERVGGNGRSLVRRQPVGVVAAITPWNAPLHSPMIKLAPALAAGCSIVHKPSTLTPLTGALLFEALQEAGVPDGVVNYVPGEQEAGRRLVAHPDVDKIAFTGSTAVGRAIMAVAAQRIARVTLELGGKSAAIMLPDCDTETFVDGVLRMGILLNSGQVCHCQSRLLVPNERYDEVAELLTERARAARVGDPFDRHTVVGPLVSEAQRARVEGYIESGVAEGASITTGGRRPPGLERGWFVEPTVFTNVSRDLKIAQEEIFGPVAVVIRYTDENEAVEITNDTSYGLSGSVWSQDRERALRIARRLRTGSVSINGAPQSDTAPRGGFKQSGIGREAGPEGLERYTEVQSIAASP